MTRAYIRHGTALRRIVGTLPAGLNPNNGCIDCFCYPTPLEEVGVVEGSSHLDADVARPATGNKGGVESDAEIDDGEEDSGAGPRTPHG